MYSGAALSLAAMCRRRLKVVGQFFLPHAQAAWRLLKHASAVARSPRSYGQRLRLAEGTSPRGIKPPRCTSADLFFFCCDSAAALPALVNCNAHVAKTIISRPHPPTPSALCTAPTARLDGVEKTLHSPVRDTRANANGVSCFPRQLELELIQTQIAEEPMLRAEVYAPA